VDDDSVDDIASYWKQKMEFSKACESGEASAMRPSNKDVIRTLLLCCWPVFGGAQDLVEF